MVTRRVSTGFHGTRRRARRPRLESLAVFSLGLPREQAVVEREAVRRAPRSRSGVFAARTRERTSGEDSCTRNRPPRVAVTRGVFAASPRDDGDRDTSRWVRPPRRRSHSVSVESPRKWAWNELKSQRCGRVGHTACPCDLSARTGAREARRREKDIECSCTRNQPLREAVTRGVFVVHARCRMFVGRAEANGPHGLLP